MIRLFISSLSILFLSFFSLSAQAGWKCSQGYQDIEPVVCSRAGTANTPQAFIDAYVSAIAALNVDSNVTGHKSGTCSIWSSGEGGTCRYSWVSYGTSLQGAVDVAKEATAANCPATLESRGPNSSVTKTGDKYYVTWSVRSVTSNVCHDSCSYLAESAAVSNCYLVAGSTSSGFCNYFVGLDSSNPSCSVEAGYTPPGTGDSLTASPNPGDGGNSGSDGGSGDGGTGGGSDGGSTGGTGFDGELSFSSPGALDTAHVIDSELNSAKYNSFVAGMQTDFNESSLGEAINNFNNKIGAAGQQGVCPTAQIPLFGTVISLDAHCYLFSGVSPILSIVLMAAWSLLAVRIFLSA